jgi:hypothetical protein
MLEILRMCWSKLPFKCKSNNRHLGQIYLLQMFLRPTAAELKIYAWMDCNVCTKFYGRSSVDGTRQSNFAILDFTKK